MHSLLNKLFYHAYHYRLWSVLYECYKERGEPYDDWLSQRSITLTNGWWHLNLHGQDMLWSIPLGRDVETAYKMLRHNLFGQYGQPLGSGEMSIQWELEDDDRP